MKKNAVVTVSIILLLCVAGLLGVVLNTSPAVASAVLEVPAQYNTIQAAINAANNGETVLVAAGTYYESVVVNKTITLLGSGKNVTFIRGNGLKAVVTVEANSVQVSGFSIQNGVSGVSVSGYNSTVVSNNTVISNINQGIKLVGSHNNQMVNNSIYLNSAVGIYLEYSTNNLISGNVLSRNKYAGIELHYSDTNTIRNNTITFHETVPQQHNQGIWLTNSSSNIIHDNTISKNVWGVDIESSSNNNVLYHNNFITNTHQAESIVESSNTWDTGAEGNYWNDYAGQDVNPPDGIGDTPYDINEPPNQDRYPLMNPWQPPPQDKSPPITGDDYNGLWHNQNFAITLSAADDVSGVWETYYKLNDGTTKIVSVDGQPLITTEGANNKLEYWSIDLLGHEEKPHHFLTDIRLDKTAPTGSIIINNGASYTTSPTVTLQLSASDALSGISRMRFSNNGTVWTQLEPYATTKNWNLQAGDGAKKVYVQFQDNALLLSPSYIGSIVLDTTAPTVLIISPTSGAEVRSSNVTVQWSGTDAGVGVGYYEIRLDQDAWTNVTTAQSHTFEEVNDGPHTVEVRAVDKVGHTQTTSVSFTVNTNPPPVTFPYLVVILAVGLAAVLGTTLYILLERKRGAGFRGEKSERKGSMRLFSVHLFFPHHSSILEEIGIKIVCKSFS